jgi:ankyrin repeat protein
MDYDLGNPFRDTGARRQQSLAVVVLAIGIGLVCTPFTTFAGELHDAVRAQDNAAVEALLASGAEVDETDFIIGSALHIAVSEGNSEIARILIDHSADVEAISELQGSRALHLAAQFGNAAMLALLLESGADFEARDGLQSTPLGLAASAGHAEAVRQLLDRGANVHAKDGQYGGTPLHEAAHQGRLAVVKLLLEHGADVNATNNSGRTPFWEAAFPQSYTVVGDASLLEYLRAQGADPNAKDTSGMSVLEYVELQVRQGDVIFAQIADELRRLGVTE